MTSATVMFLSLRHILHITEMRYFSQLDQPALDNTFGDNRYLQNQLSQCNFNFDFMD